MPIYMGKKKADKVFGCLRKKKASGEPWDESDFTAFLTPLMGGKMTAKDKIKEGILLLKQETMNCQIK